MSSNLKLKKVLSMAGERGNKKEIRRLEFGRCPAQPFGLLMGDVGLMLLVPVINLLDQIELLFIKKKHMQKSSEKPTQAQHTPSKVD